MSSYRTSQLMNQTTDGSNDSIKFDLYIKTREIKQIAESLQQVMLMSKKDRQAWVKEHEPFVNQLLDTFMEDASSALDGLYLDNEALKMSMDFVMNLRDAINTLQGILYERSNLKS
ncbi:MAG TPA: hypothetical protein VD999_02840 [Vitreimonas sp.]|nr:hypothetical protein [Vitreimonas sp.]